jgi:hypothetical protein
VVALRMRIFTWVNGDEGIQVPGPLVDADRFVEVYSHPAANGRSRGAALSDLFWYWLAPGPHVHQEHLEAGERYDEVARTTRRFLARPRTEIAELTERCARRVLDELGTSDLRVVRLRDLMMPIWAEVYYELVFGERCPSQARALVVANATDVITALKCCGLRHMDRRNRLTRFLRERLASGPPVQPLPTLLSPEEQAWYLQGTFFNTAVVQMSEAMAHLLLAIAQNPDVQRRLAAEPEDHVYADQVIDESLRRYPLFGIAHRITTDEIVPAGRIGALLQLPGVPRRRLRASRGLRSRPVAGPAPARGELRPVRRHGEPALSGTRCRPAHHAGGRPRGGAAFRAALDGGAHPLATQPRAVPAGSPDQPGPTSAARCRAGVHAHPRPVGGPVAQPCSARPRHLHGGRRPPATPCPAVLRAGRRAVMTGRRRPSLPHRRGGTTA